MSRRASWFLVLFFLLILFGSAVIPLRAQPALAGPAIELSPPPTNFFYDLALAPRPGGGFIAVWEDETRIYARGYDAQGRPAFPVRLLGQAMGIDVAAVGAGFVVVGLRDSETYPVRSARLYDAAGRPRGSPIPIETSESSPLAAFPRVAPDRNGGFAVVWVGHPSPLDPEEVFLRRFSSRGVPQGEPLRVNRVSGAAGVSEVDLAWSPGGEILVVWLEQDPWLVWGQLYLPSGEPAGSPFQISRGGSFSPPQVIAAAGGFFVAWYNHVATGALRGLYGRFYDRAGHPRGEPFPIASENNDSFSAPVLAADAQGRAWVAALSTHSGIYIREIGSDGSLGRTQVRPSVWYTSTPLAAAGWGDGDLAVAWEWTPPDALSVGLVAQRFTHGKSPGVLALAVGQIATSEGEGPVTLNIERREGTLGAVSIDYIVRARSASEGVDFLPVSGTVTFADGDSTPKSLALPVLDDVMPEEDETFLLELSNPEGGARLSSRSRTRIEIRDDDVPSPLLRNAGAITELDNTFTGEPTIRRPLVTVLAGGGSVALWQVRYRHDDLPALAERLYDAEGREIARNFSSFARTTGAYLTAQPGGGFTIVNGDYEEEASQRFNSRGQPLTTKLALPGVPAAIAAGRSGGLLTLWTGPPSAGTQEISLGIYRARGQPLGPRQPVHSSPACNRTAPVLASDRLGRAVVAWLSSDCKKILARRADVQGRFLEDVLDVLHPRVSADVDRLGIAAAPDGRFVVVWQGDGDGAGWGIFARVFGVNGRPLGPVFQVNSRRIGDQELPRVAMQGDGRFLVIWQSPGELVRRKLFGQYFAADGRRLGGEFPLDSEEPYAEEIDESLATNAEGLYVVAWRRGGETMNQRRLPAPR